jgi:MFS family permease
MLGKPRGGISLPEYRLPLSIGAATFLPAVIAMYGWIPYAQWPVWLLQLCTALIGFGLILVLVPLSSYIVDSFGLYSASAMTIVLVSRCLGGTLLPLTVPLLTNWLGLGYGFLVLAIICLLLIPLPVVVMRYGSHWRQRSEYTRND